jgi:hypothetical protein
MCGDIGWRLTGMLGVRRRAALEFGNAGRPVTAGMLALAFTALAALASPGSSAAVAAESCPNADRRAEQAVGLPDCRAYEMVTPPDKDSGEPRPVLEGAERYPLQPSLLPPTVGVRAAVDGKRLAWVSELSLMGSVAPGLSYLSTRGSGGWSSQNQVPSLSVSNDLLCPWLSGVSGWSTDLSRGILDLFAGPPRGFKEEEECGHDEPRLVAGEPEMFRNLFLQEPGSGLRQLVNVTPAGVVWPQATELNQEYLPASFLAGSDDLSHVVFEEELALTPDAPVGYPGGNELYEWTQGSVRLVTILPGGTPVHGSLAGATRNYAAFEPRNIAQFRHAVSAGGSRVFFEAEGSLYLREGGAETVRIDESHGPDPSGGGRFMLASADGSRVFFTDEGRLTADSTAASGAPDLYEYDVNSEQLTDLTVDAGEPAHVLGVSGASENGSSLYFVATAALTGEQTNSEGAVADPGLPNLYLLRGGQTTFIATLDPSTDECDWISSSNCAEGGFGSGLTARVSANGAFIGFNSTEQLTGYDNADANTGEPDIEIFLYDATEGRLSCASCSPEGAPPVGGAAIRWPSQPALNNSWRNMYPQRSVSDRGQVFFETVDSLLSRDTNGRDDVYEYQGGQLHLISTGTDEAASHFLDASADGSDVFFGTAERLLPRDIDATYDYYDARAGGGFAEPAPPGPPCGAGSCHGSEYAAPGSIDPGTTRFTGHGNLRHRAACGALAKRARALGRRAAALRRKAATQERKGHSAERMLRHADKLLARADRLRRGAKHCRSTSGGAGK